MEAAAVGLSGLRLLVAAERGAGEGPPRALLAGFARDLLGAEAVGTVGAGGGGGGGGRREASVGRRRGWRRWGGCRLAFLLFGPGEAAAAASGRARRELVRDVRGQVAPGAALVAVLVVPAAAGGGGEAEAEAARLRLEALLRRACAGRPPALPAEALQAAVYRPGSPQPAAAVQAAARRALQAALQLPADGVETEKPRLPAFLRCFSWGRRSQKNAGCLGEPEDTSGDDGLQEVEEGVALTNLAPNGNCEEACGVAAT